MFFFKNLQSVFLRNAIFDCLMGIWIANVPYRGVKLKVTHYSLNNIFICLKRHIFRAQAFFYVLLSADPSHRTAFRIQIYSFFTEKSIQIVEIEGGDGACQECYMDAVGIMRVKQLLGNTRRQIRHYAMALDAIIGRSVSP